MGTLAENPSTKMQLGEHFPLNRLITTATTDAGLENARKALHQLANYPEFHIHEHEIENIIKTAKRHFDERVASSVASKKKSTGPVVTVNLGSTTSPFKKASSPKLGGLASKGGLSSLGGLGSLANINNSTTAHKSPSSPKHVSSPLKTGGLSGLGGLGSLASLGSSTKSPTGLGGLSRLGGLSKLSQ